MMSDTTGLQSQSERHPVAAARTKIPSSFQLMPPTVFTTKLFTVILCLLLLKPFECASHDGSIAVVIGGLAASNTSSSFKGKRTVAEDDVTSGIRLLASLGLPLDSLPKFGSDVSEQCRAASDDVRRQAEMLNMWALKIMDASAKVPSGLLSGNMNNFGDFDLCMSAVGPDMRGTYCLADVDIAFTEPHMKQIDERLHAFRFMTSNITDLGQRLPKLGQWRWGICVPSACSAADVSSHVKQLLTENLPSSAVIQVQANPIMCYSKQDLSYSGGFYLTVVLFALLAGAVASGTLLDMQASSKDDQLHRFLKCFSLKRTWSELIKVERESDDLPAIHGARFFNAIGLLLSHKKMAQLFLPFSNAVFVSEKMDSELTMIGRAAILYTDSFILISGLLTAFSMVKTLDRDGKINMRRTILTRYIRFTPNLLFLIMTCTYLTEMLGPGPLWGLVVTKYSQLCKANMWRNILYIHNYFGFDDMCLTHTHQLGIDMQLFLASPLLVYVLWKRPRFGALVLSLIAAGSTYLRYTVALREQLTPIIHYGVSVDRLFRTARLSYTLPTHRATVYVLGLLLGYAARRGAMRISISSSAARLGWAAAVLCAVLSVFGPAHMGRRGYVYDAHEAAAYNAFAPLLWCFFLLWSALASWNNRGGWFSDLLSWKYFSIFSRISYAFYLVQFPIFFYNVGTQRTSQHYTGILALMDIKEFIMVTTLAVLLTVAVDLPFQNVRKMLMPFQAVKRMSKKENNNELSELDSNKIKNHG